MTAEFPWEGSPLRVPRTMHRVAVGACATLFCESRQQLFALNATADRIWRSLAADGNPAHAIDALRSDGVPGDVACAFVRDSVAAWIADGQLIPAEIAEQLAGPAHHVRHLRLHELAVEIRFYGDAAPDETDLAFGQFAAPSVAPDALTIAIAGRHGQFFAFADGSPLGAIEACGVVPEIKAVVTERYTQAVRGAFLAHAALLAKDERAVVLSGAPGAGKTTLCLALIHAGFLCAADDIVRFDRDGAAEGVPFAPAVKSGAWPLVAEFIPEIEALSVCRRRDGQVVRYLPLPKARNRPYTVGCVFLLERVAGAAAHLDELEPVEAFSAILASAFSPKGAIDPPTLKAFARTIGDARCYRIVYSDLDGAVRAISEAAG